MFFRRQLLDMVESMPAFPASVNRVMELAADINCNHKELVQVIEHDPVMTLKVLKLVNSSYFGLAREMTSINHAVVYVGLNTVKNLAISIASIGMLPTDNEAGMNMDKFLYHSISTATLSKWMAKHMGVTDRESSDFFVAGLLHDFGKIVFTQFMPKEYKEVLFIQKNNPDESVQIEKKVIGADHTQVGALLGEKWNLSSKLTVGIKAHHSTEFDNTKDNNLLIHSVFIANKLSKEIEEKEDLLSFSDELNTCITDRLGDNSKDIKLSPKELTLEVKKSLMSMRI